MDTTKIYQFLKPVNDNMLYEQEWFWLEQGDAHLDNPYNYGEQFLANI
jgi:hypothetical protein